MVCLVIAYQRGIWRSRITATDSGTALGHLLITPLRMILLHRGLDVADRQQHVGDQWRASSDH